METTIAYYSYKDSLCVLLTLPSMQEWNFVSLFPDRYTKIYVANKPAILKGNI